MDETKCPTCGATGKGVKSITLHSLLRPEKQALIGDNSYFFCGSPGCETVYFAEIGGETFPREDLTVRVGVKESAPPRPVCYCFGHSIETIFDEVERTGKITVIAGIKKRIAAEGCSCETRNPQGACCLGTVEDVVRAAYARFSVEEGSHKTKNMELNCCGPDSCCK